MIITRIQGGLGNQMFQYACGRAIAHGKGVPLKLDTTQFEEYSGSRPRPYQLGAFNISAPIATKWDYIFSGLPSMRYRSIFARIVRKIFDMVDTRRPLTSRKIVIEKDFSFMPEIFNIRNNSLLVGNWQSEKYFLHIEDIIRKEFTLKEGFGSEGQKFANMISAEKRGAPVSFHVRRGDSVSVTASMNFHGSPDISYYRDAARLMREKAGSVVFYVFSDDIPWVREHLLAELEPAVIVSSPKIKDAEDILLMSKCRHNIIAHSSFSWWGAWLNPHADKIVIGPRRWYKKDVDTSDLTPSSWIRINNVLM